LHMNDAHGAGPRQTNLHQGLLEWEGEKLPYLLTSSLLNELHSSTSRVGIVTAIVRTSSSEKPASSRRCANIANPSATGGLMVCPRAVEITVRETPVLRMFSNATSHGALFV